MSLWLIFYFMDDKHSWSATAGMQAFIYHPVAGCPSTFE